MLFFSNIYKLLFISFLCMKLTRILRSTTETFNSYTESSRTHIYNIDDEKVDLETFEAAENQRCLYKSERHYFDSPGIVIPEGRASSSTTVIKQYLLF